MAHQATESNVKLPRAVLRRSAAIQARIDARNAPPEPKPAPAVPQDPPPGDPKAATPVDPPAPPVDPTPQPAADPRENDPAYWRQRFNVTAGVLRTEREARREETDATNQRLTEMQEQIRTLQAGAQPTPDTLDVSKFFTPEQIEQFGEEQCRAMAKAAMTSAQSAVQEAIDREVTPLREAQERQKTQTVEERKQAFTDRLAELVPSYAEIDTDPTWLAWLAQEDESTGLERQGILSQHIAALNAPKVAKMFDAFLRTRAAPPQPPIVGRGNAAGPSGDPPPVAPQAVKAPTDAEVRDYFKRAALGRVKDAERVDFEARMKLRGGR
jgi:hypothetical protein